MIEQRTTDVAISLRTKIDTELSALVERRCVMLDVPNHRNWGDKLIWQGQEDWLAEHSRDVTYRANWYCIDWARAQSGVTALVTGGGNFGDLYPISLNHRIDILQRVRGSRVVFLPQTLCFVTDEARERARIAVRSHPDAVVCTRDHASYAEACSLFGPERSRLVPDMAFAINQSRLVSSVKSSGRGLVLKRTDRELASTAALVEAFERVRALHEKWDIRDWESFEGGPRKRWLVGKADALEVRAAQSLLRLPMLDILVDSAYGLRSRSALSRDVTAASAFLSQYDTVVTTRLHGLILAIILGKRTIAVDNNYGKLSSFFDTWLMNTTGVEFIRNVSSSVRGG